MEKDRQHAVVASMEISVPGERLGRLFADEAADDADGDTEADGLLMTGADPGFAVLRTVRGGGAMDGEAAAWLAGTVIEP